MPEISKFDTLTLMAALFVEADEPLLIFPSIEVAERYLEATDVRNGNYPRAFGRRGEPFAITAVGDAVVIERLDAPTDVEGLRALLRKALAEVGEPLGEDTDLDTLISHAEAFWIERDPFEERFTKPLPWWGCLLLLVFISGAVYVVWKVVAWALS